MIPVRAPRGIPANKSPPTFPVIGESGNLQTIPTTVRRAVIVKFWELTHHF